MHKPIHHWSYTITGQVDSERKLPRTAGTRVSQQDSPEVTVEVRGEKLPNVNPEDEIKVEILVPVEH